MARARKRISSALPGYPEGAHTGRFRVQLQEPKPYTPEWYIAQEMQKRARIAKAKRDGRVGGFKYGRPSKKPLNPVLKRMYDAAYLVHGSDFAARAALVKLLSEKYDVTRVTARTWLRDAKIGKRKKRAP